jgi:benzoyl-CoA reductase/2-hydroxyglutaryl-CoA dehydratase subunit BcrC/BadD/HgdB
MSIDAEEFLLPNFLNINLKFFSGEKQIRKFRRQQRLIVGNILPIGTELVFAAKGAPIFPLRIGKFEAEKLLRGTRLATNILGSSIVGTGARMIQPQADDIVNQFLSEYTKNLAGFETKSDEFNFPSEVCFATRIAYGSTLPFLNFIKLFLAWGTRCGWFSQFYQLLNDDVPVTFTDIPSSDAAHAKEYMYNELRTLIQTLESMTGNQITDEGLREVILVANEIRASYRELLEYLKTPDKMPISPYAYMQALALINIGFIDFLSSLKFFHKNLTKLLKVYRSRKPIDCSHVPRLLLVPVFSGSEPDLPQIVNQLGGLLVQADWWGYGLLDPIKTEGDMVRNYGDYLIKTHMGWKDNKTVSETWLRMAKDLNVDGIIFNRLVGCTSITPAHRIFIERVQDSGIPYTTIEFNRIGENFAQVTNKISALIEIIKKV